ncbi:purine-cytosine permease family protein [Alicyclobacillus fodiniaquatilis]|uniref:Purine-cytosine permease family protein n=1 Tax=Alicyclobacillus fodiniaquatilis TaxID=1661150 RepID=A0ABW4JT59_9BACL
MPAAEQSKRNRNFNKLVNNPVLEDYSLRYAPSTFRKWSPWAVCLSGIGGVAAMASYAIGGSLVITYGIVNALLGILVTSIIIFFTSTPIAFQIAKYNIDMDLLTRGAGFGYLGSTLTSLIYSTFTFVFFALEGAIMGQAITDFFHIPIFISYLICGVVIIPLVLYGMTLLTKFQKWTQPIWIALLVLAIGGVMIHDPSSLNRWMHFAGGSKSGVRFSPLMFGMVAGVQLSGIAQIGEQADYLRFMPDRTNKNRRAWAWAVIIGGPGFALIGIVQSLIGTYLASYVTPLAGAAQADVPITMFNYAFHALFGSPYATLLIATLLVLLSQLKINVSNAYSGSLSWSNFFSRTLHTHPGRVVWLLFQVVVGVLIMELGVFNTIDKILGFYSNVAVAWIGAIVADIMINKRILKLSPSYIEFKRAHLYNFNPVGFGSMIIASVVSIIAYFGVFGPMLQAYAPFLSLVLAMILAPTIAIITKGKYYIARTSSMEKWFEKSGEVTCTVCKNPFEAHDIAFCPFHSGPICSLCCSLESSCHDACKVGASSLSPEQESGTYGA